MIFARQIQFLDNLENLIYKEFQQALNNFGFELEEAITEDQLYNRGVDGFNNPIKNKQTGALGYTRTTIRIKIAKGQPVDRITLRDTNKFHPSIQIKAFSDRFEVSSNITKTKLIFEKYGVDVIRPTQENIKAFVDKNFIPNLKTTINGKFTG